MRDNLRDGGAIPSEGIQGDERGTQIALSRITKTNVGPPKIGSTGEIPEYVGFNEKVPSEHGCGRDSIEGMDLLRDGAMEAVFGGVRAPSTLGSFLRSFTWGNVHQPGKAHRSLTAALAADPRLLPGREELAFIDIDSTQERVYGCQKEGAAFGHAKVQGESLLLKDLNALISVISIPLAAPVPGPARSRRPPCPRPGRSPACC